VRCVAVWCEFNKEVVVQVAEGGVKQASAVLSLKVVVVLVAEWRRRHVVVSCMMCWGVLQVVHARCVVHWCADRWRQQAVLCKVW
jgi:hypothetical protein